MENCLFKVMTIQSCCAHIYIVFKQHSLLLVPPPQLTFTITPSTILLYEGIALSLICSASLDSFYLNTAFSVSVVWTGPSGAQLENSSRITIVNVLQSPPYTSMLMFDPVDDVDSGDYQCNISVTFSNSRVLSSSNSSNVTLNITGETPCTGSDQSHHFY